MRRPKDIQQDIWEKAGWLVDAVVRQALVHNAPDSQTVIARAIMAAKAEEREAVKHWLTREAEINDELETQIVGADGKGWHKHFADVQRRNVDAIEAGRHVEKYAAAIRKHGQVNGAHISKNRDQ